MAGRYSAFEELGSYVAIETVDYFDCTPSNEFSGIVLDKNYHQTRIAGIYKGSFHLIETVGPLSDNYIVDETKLGVAIRETVINIKKEISIVKNTNRRP